MKNLLRNLLVCGTISLALFACNKNSSHSSSGSGTPALTLSASTVLKGQPLVVTAPAGIASSSIKWSVNSPFAHLSSGNGQAMVIFARAGNYRVTANYRVHASSSDSTSDSTSSPITVSDSTYTPPPTSNYDTVSLAGDQITLTPSADSAHNLVLLAQTMRSYDCFPTFLWSVQLGLADHAGISINFRKVIAGSFSGNCNGVQNPAASYIFFLVGGTTFSNGTYPFFVLLNNTVYQGSLTITDAAYTFTWNYTSGVIFSTQTVNR
jgi:hypothetical protein